MTADASHARLLAIADLFTPMALRVAATLRLADHIAAGAESVEALAERTATDPDALGRLVAHLVSVDVLARDGDGALSVTELGAQLRDEHPDNGRAWLDIGGAVGRADLSALHLLDAVRTGQTAYRLTYGRGIWEDLAADPELSDSFDRLMSSRLALETPGIVAGYDWSTVGHLVDVGGGDGTLMAAILSAHADLRGTLVELPGPAAAARRTFAQAGLGDRCAVVADSFWDPLPSGADAYMLSGVLQDWDDEHALVILRRCAEAAQATTGRVLLIEHLHHGAGDLRMFAYNGGRERTLDEIEGLVENVGLRVSGVHRATANRTVIELHAWADGVARRPDEDQPPGSIDRRVRRD